MEIDKYTTTDVLYDVAFTHLRRLEPLSKDLKENFLEEDKREVRKKIACEIDLYQRDFFEILEESREAVSYKEMDEIIDKCRENFNFYCLEIFNNK